MWTSLVVKHRVRDTNWSFRWLWRLSSVSITEDCALFVRRTFIFLFLDLQEFLDFFLRKDCGFSCTQRSLLRFDCFGKKVFFFWIWNFLCVTKSTRVTLQAVQNFPCWAIGVSLIFSCPPPPPPLSLSAYGPLLFRVFMVFEMPSETVSPVDVLEAEPFLRKLVWV